MLPERRGVYLRLICILGSAGIGISVGCLILGGGLGLLPKLLPPTLSPGALITLVLSVHGIISLTSLASGLAVAFNLAWAPQGVQLPKICRYYSFAMASFWFVVTSWTLWRFAALVWPLFAADMTLVFIAGFTGLRLTPVDPAVLMPRGQSE